MSTFKCSASSEFWEVKLSNPEHVQVDHISYDAHGNLDKFTKLQGKRSEKFCLTPGVHALSVKSCGTEQAYNGVAEFFQNGVSKSKFAGFQAETLQIVVPGLHPLSCAATTTRVNSSAALRSRASTIWPRFKESNLPKIDLKSGVPVFTMSPSTFVAFTFVLFWFVKTLRWTGKLLLTARAKSSTPSISRTLSNLLRTYSYSEEGFFTADGATGEWIRRRQDGINRLVQHFNRKYSKSIEWGEKVRSGFSDLRFTDACRVPFPFAQFIRDRFKLCTVVTSSKDASITDIDGNSTIDISGAYGVNVAGNDMYKQWMQKGLEKVKDLGPVLGPLHPIVLENIDMLKKISGQEEVSFHMSGTEAVMAAVRLARFNTGRKLIVTFSGAYHGWWDGVQPGLGSERDIEDCLTFKEMLPISLDAIRARSSEIAAVLINPIQSFHPNMPPPNDVSLLASHMRKAEEATEKYGKWLQELREVCTRNKVPLIFDEVFSGFRLAPGGAQEVFGVKADMVVYGKTVAGGLPIGVICGKSKLMCRFDVNYPMRIAYVVGTFSGHPAVMGAMNEFLHWATDSKTPALYSELNQSTSKWVLDTNRQLEASNLPVRVVNFFSVWTILFTEPGRYNWLLQYYLRAEGVTLSWVGTGRCLTNMGFTQKDFESLGQKLVNAVTAMRNDGWWLSSAEYPNKDLSMKLALAKEMAHGLLQPPYSVQEFYEEVMRRKHDDHVASHSDPTNQLFHIISSTAFLICYVLVFFNMTTTMWIGLPALFLRQIGHAILEPPCHDKEETLLGFNTISKSFILGTYLILPVMSIMKVEAWTPVGLSAVIDATALHWFLLTLIVITGKVVWLTWTLGFRLGTVWFVKLSTDPVTDLFSYIPQLFFKKKLH